jgi:hypothetical protein
MFSVRVNRETLLSLIHRLGEEFARRDMPEHTRRLRLFWLAARHGLLKGQNELDVKWSEAHLLDWLEALRLPPYDGALPVRAKGAGCPRCGCEPGVLPSGRTVLVFPGGVKMRCQACAQAWLELE